MHKFDILQYMNYFFITTPLVLGVVYKNYLKKFANLLGEYTYEKLKQKLTVKPIDRTQNFLTNSFKLYSILTDLKTKIKADSLYFYVFHNGLKKDFLNVSLRFEISDDQTHTKINFLQNQPFSKYIKILEILKNDKYIIVSDIQEQFLELKKLMFFFKEKKSIFLPVVKGNTTIGLIELSYFNDTVDLQNEEIINSLIVYADLLNNFIRINNDIYF
jgi:hypothetical protein